MYAYLDKKGTPTFQVAVPSYALSSRYNPVPYWLELVGPQQSCRALWANLVKKRERRYESSNVVLSVGSTAYYLYNDESARFHSLPTSAGLLIIANGLDKLHGRLLLGGDSTTPSPWFQAALQRQVNVPFLPEWQEKLWQKGIASGMLHAPELQDGVTLWLFESSNDRWAKMITEMVKKREVAWHV